MLWCLPYDNKFDWTKRQSAQDVLSWKNHKKANKQDHATKTLGETLEALIQNTAETLQKVQLHEV